MDCYRILSANDMAEHLAEEVIEASTDFDGQERAPMRLTEARITVGVVKAREGDLEGAVSLGTQGPGRKDRGSPGLGGVPRKPAGKRVCLAMGAISGASTCSGAWPSHLSQ